MTPGDHTARRLALQDARLVPLEWLTVVQVLDTECPPHPSGIVRLAQPTAPRVPPPPRVVRHRRMRWSQREIAGFLALLAVLAALVADPVRVAVHLAAGAVIASVVTGIVTFARKVRTQIGEVQ